MASSPAEQPVSAKKIDFLQCPAKTYTDDNKKTVFGYTVLEHCLIVAYIAKELLIRLSLPEALRELFPEQTRLIAALHDIGKISPTFFIKLANACGIEWREIYPELESYKTLRDQEIKDMDASFGYHARIGAVIIYHLYSSDPCKISEQLATIVGQHHGTKPKNEVTNADSCTDIKYGGERWQQGRLKVIDKIKQDLQTDFSDFRELTDIQEIIISGLVTVADWIGSGTWFTKPDKNWRQYISAALDDAGYIPFKLRKGLSFEEIFQLAPREAQQQFISVCNKPGTYILEAPMGIGKTEAALYAAYTCLQQGLATGFYFALPTQLTSNKIHQRVEKFLNHILVDDPDNKNINKILRLLHSSAWLQNTQMGEEGSPGGSWFDSSKRGLLAPFAVGTLDQALLAVMNTQHNFVRAFGLLGKVVIIDEVHSYHFYTGSILNKLITLLQDMHCTIIILTATLTQYRRAELLGEKPSVLSAVESPYPLISYRVEGAPVKTMALTPPDSQQVTIRLQATATPAELEIVFDEALQRAQDGQQVLWIENTVIDAQKRYFDLAARCGEIGVECGLLHSRFMPQHRETNENHWVKILGKDGHEQRRQKGRLLIGTQVLEQSLDIDADFLVSRFAPVDLLLQRMGRLWRHADTPRPRGAQRESWILAPDLNLAINNPDAGFGRSAMVYSPYWLCRSLETLQKQLAHSATVSLPDDIRSLIENTYAEQTYSDLQDKIQYKLAVMQNELKKQIRIYKQKALEATAEAAISQDDKQAKTRYGDDSATIFLFKSISSDSKLNVTNLELVDEIDYDPQTEKIIPRPGQKIVLPICKSELTANEWRTLSCRIMQQKVSCRQSQLPDKANSCRCEKLGFRNVLYLGNNHDCAPFALVCIDESTGELQCFEQAGKAVKYRYNYRLGLYDSSQVK